jgi:hypothetical protein
MDLPTTIVILLVGAALIGWLAGARDGRGLEVFGLGFIGYRSYGWPRGVQEEDTVHFSFVDGTRRAVDVETDAGSDMGPGAELIELDHPSDTVVTRRLR